MLVPSHPTTVIKNHIDQTDIKSYTIYMYDNEERPWWFNWNPPKQRRKTNKGGGGKKITVPKKPYLQLPEQRPQRAQWVKDTTDHMKANGWSFRAIAWRLGVVESSIFNWRNNVTRPPNTACYLLDIIKDKKPPRKRKPKY